MKKYTHLIMEEELLMTLHILLSVREADETTQILFYIFLLRYILKHLDRCKCGEHLNVGVKFNFVYRR